MLQKLHIQEKLTTQYSNQPMLQLQFYLKPTHQSQLHPTSQLQLPFLLQPQYTRQLPPQPQYTR